MIILIPQSGSGETGGEMQHSAGAKYNCLLLLDSTGAGQTLLLQKKPPPELWIPHPWKCTLGQWKVNVAGDGMGWVLPTQTM